MLCCVLLYSYLVWFGLIRVVLLYCCTVVQFSCFVQFHCAMLCFVVRLFSLFLFGELFFVLLSLVCLV